MLIPKQNRKLIYESLFKEGVLVAKKDFNAPKHQDIDVPNLHVIKACQSLNSKEYVKTQFSWQYYYYSLTNEGIEYLREYLHLPSEIVPATFKKQARPAAAGGRSPREEGGRGPQTRDRGEYRRNFEGVTETNKSNKDGATGDYNPSFKPAGIGRGRGRAE
ncbi:10280_t:CDS:2 [Ambispora gerdemannii]|uniref:10280_t:CDS:1 n=1 Tax=Ambispora gerdemannii TaxID=144530 RepID=A0A9N8V506_9GLOM|nr:10280_t:CDS:2 [Ambispora gerdemannii]